MIDENIIQCPSCLCYHDFGTDCKNPCCQPIRPQAQERREFVKAYVLAIINGYHANGCHGGSEDVNFLHITEDGARRFDILDKQLTELEEKEEK